MATVLNTKFEELCRLCGARADSLAVHIFEDEGTFSELGKKIFSCLQIQIDQQDELPKLLCDNCLVKLEMFWEFKYRSLKTEQFLIDLCKQLKSSQGDQQCLVQIEDSGMILEVPNQHQVLSHHLPSDITMSSLDRRHQDHLEPANYSVVLSHDSLEGLELGNHHLTGQDMSNHSMHNNVDSTLKVISSESQNTFTTDSLGLMQMGNMSIVNNPMYSDTYIKPEQLHDLNSVDNSLGADVESHLKQIISGQDGVVAKDYGLILHDGDKNQSGSGWFLVCSIQN